MKSTAVLSTDEATVQSGMFVVNVAFLSFRTFSFRESSAGGKH